MKNRRFSEQERLDRRRLLAASGAAILALIQARVSGQAVVEEVKH
jgi:hypothetical protein